MSDEETKGQAENDATECPAAFAMPRPSPKLAALTTSALALPGIVGSAHADAPIERASASSSFSYYREDQIRQNKKSSATGSNKRYEVYAKQLRVDLPATERTDIGIDFLYESMSGASPISVTRENGRLVSAMSGATIEDERYDLNLDLDYYLDEGKDTISAGFSTEKDYDSVHVGLATTRNFNDKNTTLDLAGTFAYDWIEPTGGGTNNRIVTDEKWSVDLFMGLAQIISRASTAQITINYKHSEGFLSDPYKRFLVDASNSNFNDARPEKREMVSIMGRYRHHFEDVEGSLHLDYRFFADSWEMVSHTIEVGWYQTLFDSLTIKPAIRWYSQSKADFYEPIFAVRPTYGSSDYRLSPYGAVSAKIRFDYEVLDAFNYDPPEFLQAIGITEGLDVVASLSYERYISNGHFGLQSVGEFEEAPALVSFQVIAFTLSGQF